MLRMWLYWENLIENCKPILIIFEREVSKESMNINIKKTKTIVIGTTKNKNI